MKWTRTDTLALASHRCALCHGLGLRLGDKSAGAPCGCVLRSIFRACYARFVECSSKERIHQATLEASAGRDRKTTWGRKDEEYVADFMLIARRTLSESDYKILRFHYVLGADWKICCAKLKMDRGNFFHAVYRIQRQLGRAFRETEPYGLFPLDDYFNGMSKVDQYYGKTGKTVSIRDLPAHLRFPEMKPSVRPGVEVPGRRAA